MNPTTCTLILDGKLKWTANKDDLEKWTETEGPSGLPQKAGVLQHLSWNTKSQAIVSKLLEN